MTPKESKEEKLKILAAGDIHGDTDLAERLAERAEKEHCDLVILCGDLNDTPVSYCYRQFNSLLDDAFIASGNGIGTTYIGEIPSNRIDYIFYSPALGSANFTTHEVDYSDHKPISCEVGYLAE